jgi:hypothetical protein
MIDSFSVNDGGHLHRVDCHLLIDHCVTELGYAVELRLIRDPETGGADATLYVIGQGGIYLAALCGETELHSPQEFGTRVLRPFLQMVDNSPVIGQGDVICRLKHGRHTPTDLDFVVEIDYGKEVTTKRLRIQADNVGTEYDVVDD